MPLNHFFKERNTGDIYFLLKAIFEEAIDGIIAINRQGIIEAVNPAAAQLFAYAADEIIGQNIKILMPSPDQERHDTYIENYHQTGIKKIIGIGREVRGRRKDGSVFPFRLSVNEVKTNDRQFYTGFIHDVSDLHQAKTQLEMMNAQLEKLVEARTEELSDVVNRLLKTNQQLKHEVKERESAESALRERETEIRQAYKKEKELGRLKSRFVSMTSHEFRTPLTTINSSAALLARYVLTEHQSKREKHIDRIKNSVAHLTGVLDDILSLSKLEEGVIKPQSDKIIWKDFCHTTIEELQGNLKSGQQIVCQNEAKELIFESDKRLLKHIFFNLLSNAIKYSPERTSIILDSQVKANQLIINIIDTGIGIPQKEQQYLFTRFFRAKNAANIQGTGLGLAIVKKYVAILDGKIRFESIENEGTTFTVTLPLYQTQE